MVQVVHTSPVNPPLSLIEPGLYLGQHQSAAKNHDVLKDRHITNILSVMRTRGPKTWYRDRDTDEWILRTNAPELAWTTKTMENGKPRLCFAWLNAVDDPGTNLLRYFAATSDLIERTLREFERERREGKKPGNILVHCQAGLSRSPAIVAAYLMRKYRWRAIEALVFVKAKREGHLYTRFKHQLQVWEKCGYDLWEKESREPKAVYANWFWHQRMDQSRRWAKECLELKLMTPEDFKAFSSREGAEDELAGEPEELVWDREPDACEYQ